MSELRHEAVLAAAMLGAVKRAGWMEVPFSVDLSDAYARLQGAGGVQTDRDHAIVFAREFMDVASEAEGWALPDFDEQDERKVAGFLGVAYDQIAAGVRP